MSWSFVLLIFVFC